MQVDNYLRKYQSSLYKTFSSQLKEDKLSHAYLICGPVGSPLFEIAKFLAKSILCDDPSPLACNNCITCLRIDDDNYPDFVVFDGSKGSIKKDNIQQVEEKFETTAFESKGKMIYVLNLVENMTIEAINSILKFLEEPGKDIYAFLTTNNENAILETIISRCQVWRLKQIDRKEIIAASSETLLNKEDVELLSYLYNDIELIEDKLNDPDFKENYLSIKQIINDVINAIANGSSSEVMYTINTYAIPKIKTKEDLRIFIDILSDFYQNAVDLKHHKEINLKSYGEQVLSLSKQAPHLEESLIEILKLKNQINLNINISLMLNHLGLLLVED